MLIFGDLHLPSILAEYGAHYNGTTTPSQPPAPAAASQPPPRRPFPGAIKRRAVRAAVLHPLNIGRGPPSRNAANLFASAPSTS